jgi:hypothetical protein
LVKPGIILLGLLYFDKFLPCFRDYTLQKKLIMVGSRGTLSTIPLLRLLVDKVAEIGGLLDLTNKDVHSFLRT